jgi:hypothetical protein
LDFLDSSEPSVDQRNRGFDNVVDVDSQLVEHTGAGCAGAEAVDPDRRRRGASRAPAR